MNRNRKTYVDFNSQEKTHLVLLEYFFNARKNKERNTKDLSNRQMDFRLLCKED